MTVELDLDIPFGGDGAGVLLAENDLYLRFGSGKSVP